MNKQELIEKYEKEKNEILDYQNSDIWKEEGILKQNSSVTALRWVFDFVEDLKKLDDQYKAKIPVYVDKWLKHCKWNNYPLSAATYDKNIKSFEKASNQTKLLKWFDTVKNQDVFARAWLDGYEVEESKWVVNEGDLVIRKGEHEAKAYFVESVDDDGILLVNGIKDEFFTDLDERSVGEESINYFYENFRLLAKKENLEVEKV
ncbi:DUF1642 domain-containing protein [uncultured Enterococcus sp.]|uniref:DUF1642 domain-containing protein n=1 Tax=uncultured Enterococcus sp. TaxID=167972 RepID=UPI0020649226|nr:DUF1642 domain-containing protein [uncultured Enterococcus sp.]DAL87373.1 MAG TPA: Protein of unknown function (DUF1642) [Caudoviricetes sp.]